MQSLGHTASPALRHNPPTIALLMLPIVWLSPQDALLVWTVISLALLFISIIILLKTFNVNITDNLGIGFLSLAVLSRPMYENIVGQVYILLLLLLSLFLYGMVRQKIVLSSFMLGTMILLKGYGFIPLVLLLFSKRWKVFLGTILTTVLLFFLCIIIFGLHAWRIFFITIVPTIGTLPQDAHVAYQSINGLLHHLIWYDSRWSPAPFLSIEKNIVHTISICISLLFIVVFIFIYLRRRSGDFRLWLSCAFALNVLTGPLAMETHFALLFPLILGYIFTLGQVESLEIGKFSKILFCISVAVIALPFPYSSLNAATFPISLLAYPKLFSGIILLLLTFIPMKKQYLINLSMK